MRQVLLGLGSNIEPERHLQAAAGEIRQRFPDVRFSAVYRSAAVGMEGDDFLNACCLFGCDTPLSELGAWLKGLEDVHGRDRSEGSWKPRTLDLDLLMADDEVLDDDMFRYPHVYVPASELTALKLPQERGDLRRVELAL